ncbi:MAG: amidase [Alphaproteobacteria bacterium]|nr:amidase [Alphaproteobacteria bacterium]PPR13869.1 MAG: Biuret hydrolase [Alphaproteobacteria bacterium MarineAlpha12_Bin1]|tara:strand:- start:5205 stop:6404 length:1200 start_codon:yes stop_codon:yes gene_type:complete
MGDLFRKIVSGFCSHENIKIKGANNGPLKKLTFAVKDIIDVAGSVTGAGNIKFFEEGSPALKNAEIVQMLLDAGADLEGKTITEEFAYGLIGENFHYGTPRNGAAPERIPGGSSSGSASVVSNGQVDFALGTDTGGSVRVPASFCGIYGLRPSHGRVPINGVMPLAPSLDTCGWFARTPELMKLVGEVALDWKQPGVGTGLYLARDTFSVLDEESKSALAAAIDSLAKLVGPPEEIDVGVIPGMQELGDWAKVMQVVRGSEAAASRLDWIKEFNPDMGPGFRERFESGGLYSQDEITEAVNKREIIKTYLDKLLSDNIIMVVPAAPTPAPPVSSQEKVYDNLRNKNELYNCIAPLGQLPQISLPMGNVKGLPIGLGVIGRYGSDELLLEIANELNNIEP